MWGYNFNYLCHASHKYIDKYQNKSGMWTYVYEKNQNSKKGKAARERNIGSQLDSRMKSYNDTSNRRAAIEQESVKNYQEKKRRLKAIRDAAKADTHPEDKVKTLLEDRDNTTYLNALNKRKARSKASASTKVGSIANNQMKTALDPNRRSAQSSREAAIQDAANRYQSRRNAQISREAAVQDAAKRTQERNRQQALERAQAAGSQAENERRRSTLGIDSRASRNRQVDSAVQDVRVKNSARQAENEHRRTGRSYSAQNSRSKEINRNVQDVRRSRAADQAEKERRVKTNLTDYRTPTDDLVDRSAMVTRYMKSKNAAIRKRRLTKM